MVCLSLDENCPERKCPETEKCRGQLDEHISLMISFDEHIFFRAPLPPRFSFSAAGPAPRAAVRRVAALPCAGPAEPGPPQQGIPPPHPEGPGPVCGCLEVRGPVGDAMKGFRSHLWRPVWWTYASAEPPHPSRSAKSCIQIGNQGKIKIPLSQGFVGRVQRRR